MATEERTDVRPLVFSDASDYSPTGRVTVAMQRYAASEKDVPPLEALRQSNILAHPEDITRVIQLQRKTNSRSGGGGGGGDMAMGNGSFVMGASRYRASVPSKLGTSLEGVTALKSTSFSVTPEGNVEAFLSAVPDDGNSVSGSSSTASATASDVEGEDAPAFGASSPQQGTPLSTTATTAVAAIDQALYTNYHVVIVLDVSQSAFAIARNGDVLIDRMPNVIDLIIGVIRDTLTERTLRYNAAQKRASGKDSSGSVVSALIGRVWCPKVTVSLLMGNTPHSRAYGPDKVLKARPRRLGCSPSPGSAPPLSALRTRMHDVWGHATGIEGQVPFVPHNTAKPFEPWAWEAYGGGAGTSGSSSSGGASDDGNFMYADVVPIFIGRPAEEVVTDATLNHRIYAFLRQQENIIRAMAAGLAPRTAGSEAKKKQKRRDKQFDIDFSSAHKGAHTTCEVPGDIHWEASNIASLIETVVSMVPPDANTSHTVAIVSNFANAGASEDIALLRPAMVTRGITLGLFSLTAVVEWSWSHLAPIGCLLATTGGFAVPYGKLEAHRQDPNNIGWLRRIDDTDSLARSMFLRRLDDCPTVVTYASQSDTPFIPPPSTHGEMSVCDIVTRSFHCVTTLPITGLAAARVSEGWAARIEVDPDSGQPKRCRARTHCFLHRGELTLYYEAEATTLPSPDADGRMVLITTRLAAHGSSHVLEDIKVIMGASADMAIAIQRKGGRRQTISALMKQLTGFMAADGECSFVSEAPAMAQRHKDSRPRSWDDKFTTAVALHSRPQGCTLPWIYRHSVRQLPLVVQVPDLNESLSAGCLLTHDDRVAMAETSQASGTVGSPVGSAGGNDVAGDEYNNNNFHTTYSNSTPSVAAPVSNQLSSRGGPKRGRGKAGGASTTYKAPPAVTIARLATFITGALSQPQVASDVVLIKNSLASGDGHASVASQLAIGANPSLTYLAIGRDQMFCALASLVPACAVLQFFFAPAMNEFGNEITALESLAAAASGGAAGESGGGTNQRGGYATNLLPTSSILTKDASSRTSYMVANCVEVRFTFSFVSIRNQAPLVRRVMQILQEYAAAIATGSPNTDFRYFGLGASTMALMVLTSPYQSIQGSLLLTDSEGTSSAANSRIRHGTKRFGSPQTGATSGTGLVTPIIDESAYCGNHDMITALSSGYLYWSALIPAQHHTHAYRNTLACMLRRRLAMGFEVAQYTACGTWAAMYHPQTSCMDIIQVHEHPNSKGYDSVVGITRYWMRFDEVTRPSMGWQNGLVDFQRDHYILSTFFSHTAVLEYSAGTVLLPRTVPVEAGSAVSAAVPSSATATCEEFFSVPSSIAPKDLCRNGGHTTAMFCLSGLLIGLHPDPMVSSAPIECIGIKVGCHTSMCVGLEIVRRMHGVARNLTTRRHMSHTLGLRDIPQAIRSALAPHGMASAVTVSITPCDESSYGVIIVPVINVEGSPQPLSPNDELRIFVAQISIDSVTKGMSTFAKAGDGPKYYYDAKGTVRAMAEAAPAGHPKMTAICVTLGTFCVAARAWLLQRAAINIPSMAAIPKTLRTQLFDAFRPLSLYSQDVDASFINGAWGMEPSATEDRLASIIALFLHQHNGLRPLQEVGGDDEVAKTTYLVTRAFASTLMGAGGSHGSLIDHDEGESDGNVSSASVGCATDGEGGQASAPAEIDGMYVPMALRFLVYSKDSDGHGTSAWVGSTQTPRTHTNTQLESTHTGTSTARPVSLYLRIFIVSLPHDVFNITSHGFRPPTDVLRRFVQGVTEDLARAEEPIPPTWNYFCPQPFSCDELLRPYSAMPQRGDGLIIPEGDAASAQHKAPCCGRSTVCTDPILVRYLRQFPCKGVGASNLLPSPSCTDIVNGIATNFLAQTADAALTAMHKGLVKEAVALMAPTSGGGRRPLVLPTELVAPHFPTVIATSLLAPEHVYRATTVPIGIDILATELTSSGDAGQFMSTEQLMREAISQDGIPLVPLGELTYGYARALYDDGSAIVWMLVSVNSLDNTLSVYKHVTTVGVPDDALVATAQLVVDEVRKLQDIVVSALKHIYLSQYLFKVRATRQALEEDGVIPRWWGVQVADAVPAKPTNPLPPWESGDRFKPPVEGKEVLSFPIRPQFQPRRLLNQMHTTTHFDMLKITDRRGCFIVPDDVHKRSWHFMRMIIVPEGVPCQTDEYPPQLPDRPPADQRFRLVVHLYNSRSNFCIANTISAVRECYDNIALKELMQHMTSTTRREGMSDEDLKFLMREEVANGKGTKLMTVTVRHMNIFVLKMVSTLRDSKFLPIRKWALPTLLTAEEAANGTPPPPYSPGKAAFIYQDPSDPIDVISVCAEIVINADTAAKDNIMIGFNLYSSWAPRDDHERRLLERRVRACNGAIDNTGNELTVIGLIDSPELHPLGNGPAVLDTIVTMARTLHGHSTELRNLTIRNTPRLSAALFSQCVESLCGALSERNPSLIVSDGKRAPEAWADFAWHRHERVQHRVDAEQMHFYIVCGLRFGQQASGHPGAPTMGSAAGRPMDGSLSPTVRASQGMATASRALEPIPPIRVVAVRDVSNRRIDGTNNMPAVIVKVTPMETAVVTHAIPDADLLFETLSDVLGAYGKRLGMMNGLLTQMLGVQPSPFTAPMSTKDYTQGKLATRCCGDVSNVHQDGVIDITTGCVRRHMSVDRLPARFDLTPAVPALQTGTQAVQPTTNAPAAGTNPSISTRATLGLTNLFRRHADASITSGPLPAIQSQKDLAAMSIHSQSDCTPVSPNTVVAGGATRLTPTQVMLQQHFTRLIYAGLTNRGVMVDYCLPMDAAVKVLHDDGGRQIEAYMAEVRGAGAGDADATTKEPLLGDDRYSQCEFIVRALVKAQLLVESTNAHNAGLFKQIGLKNHHAFAAPAEERTRVLQIARPTAKMPVDPYVPQHYHRHLSVAHIMAEKKFMGKRMAQSMQELQRMWDNLDNPNMAMPIVYSVIRLMAISKFYYGSRVPEYSLRRESTMGSISPEAAAKYCDPKRAQLTSPDGEKFAAAVRGNLDSIARHMDKQFGSMLIVSVDPHALEDRSTMDPYLAERFANRCGMVPTGNCTTTGGGGGGDPPAVFATPITYCIMPIKTAIAELMTSRHASSGMGSRSGSVPMGGGNASSVSSPTGTATNDDNDISSGLFIIEIGFNYVNYAIDMYIATDGEQQVPYNLLAEAASAIRTRIQFSSVVYDLIVQRLFALVERRTAVLPGQQHLTDSINNILKYNPSPPRFSYNRLAADDVTNILAHIHRKGSAFELQTNLAFIPAYGGGRGGMQDDVIRFVVPHNEGLQYATTQGGKGGDVGGDGVMAFKYVGLLAWETHDGPDGKPTRRATLFTLITHPDGEAQATGEVDSVKSEPHRRALPDAREGLLRIIQSNDEQILVDKLWRQLHNGLHLPTSSVSLAIVPRRQHMTSTTTAIPGSPGGGGASGCLTASSACRTAAGLGFEVAQIPSETLPPTASMRSLLVGLDDPKMLAWEDLETLERYVTCVGDPSSELLIEDLGYCVRGYGGGDEGEGEDVVGKLLVAGSSRKPPLGWLARVPACFGGGNRQGVCRALPQGPTSIVSLSLPEAICAYLRNTSASQSFLVANNVSVHIAEVQRALPDAPYLGVATYTRLVFAPPAKAVGGDIPLGASASTRNVNVAESANFIVVVDLSRAFPASCPPVSASPSHPSEALLNPTKNQLLMAATEGHRRRVGGDGGEGMVSPEAASYDDVQSMAPHTLAPTPAADERAAPNTKAGATDAHDSVVATYVAAHPPTINRISLWREGFGSYGQTSAELADNERDFLDVVHSYMTAVMWAGFV